MRILVVSNGYPPRGQWGTEFYTRELVRALARRGHELEVLHPERSGTRPRYELESEQVEGIRVHLLHNAGDPQRRFRASYEDAEVERVFDRLLQELRPDLVHFTYLLWGLSVRLPLVCRARGVACAATLTDYGLICHRGQMYDWRLARCFGPHPPERCARCVREPSRHDAGPLALIAKRQAVRLLAAAGGAGRVVVRRDLERREQTVREALAACDALIAPTEVVAETFARFGVPRERIEPVVYSIDAGALAAARPAPASGPHAFGYLGQFTPHKGLATLLDAVEILAHRLPESVEPWEVRLYGAPSGGRHRLYAARELGRVLGPRVRVFPPFAAEQAAQVLGQLGAVVLPSEWDENAPLTLLQARAAGVPVIASSVPGVREVLEPGVHGRLFPLGDARALADAMRDLLLARTRRTGHFDLPLTLDEHVDRVERVYRSALASLASRGTRSG